MPIRPLPRFNQQYAQLPVAIQQKVDKAVRLLDADFRHPGLHSHPVQRHPGVFEAYVDDEYRMTFERRGDTFIMRNVDNHDECLRKLVGDFGFQNCPYIPFRLVTLMRNPA